MFQKRWIRRVIVTLLILSLLGAAAVFGIDAHVRGAASERILSLEEIGEFGGADCILVLGCKVHENGRPSDMLRDRLETALSLFDAGAAPKLLMSGDHGQKEYDEVNAMKDFAVDAGVKSEDVFMDHAGFSTYESLYRAREIFGCKKVIVVTQKYHLYRALYIAEALGIEARGVAADLHTYGGQTGREVREILARGKDFFSCLFRAKPTYLGEAIPISGNGDLTNDKNGAAFA
ncbi:MAG: YdcF family protein [Clostridia bacterium]|nr:YdcF family protein [Clostridia bacterium]